MHAERRLANKTAARISACRLRSWFSAFLLLVYVCKWFNDIFQGICARLDVWWRFGSDSLSCSPPPLDTGRLCHFLSNVLINGCIKQWNLELLLQGDYSNAGFFLDRIINWCRCLINCTELFISTLGKTYNFFKEKTSQKAMKKKLDEFVFSSKRIITKYH